MCLGIKVFQRKFVDLLADFPAQCIGDTLGDTGHEPSLNIGEYGRYDIDNGKCTQDAEDPVKIDAAFSGVLGNQTLRKCGRGTAEYFWTDDRKDGGGHRKDNDDKQLRIVGAKIAEELADRSAEILRFISGHHSAPAVSRTSSVRGAHASSSSLS